MSTGRAGDAVLVSRRAASGRKRCTAGKERAKPQEGKLFPLIHNSVLDLEAQTAKIRGKINLSVVFRYSRS